ncbi:HD domain-containing protein [Ureaplasma canigenitalium]|uniref:HD domain-containing protein n=1 Tax=Ureaplasma canigenitalium TaxID=42092 RepID=UPI0004E0C02E|nr:HD domain-containing protein [Ureaplasma canigenitalium]
MDINKRNYFIRCPIHGLINLSGEYEFASEIINTKEFWRLNRVKQLGNSWVVFPSATHTRFVHCIGVFEVAKKMIEKITFVDSCTENIDYYKKVVVAAALLHDIGHGPYSHAFEEATNYNHEQAGRTIIVDEQSEVNKILRKYNLDPYDVANILDHKAKHKWMVDLISSQIDCDRLDYLERDSHYTGTSYGQIDYDLIFEKAIIYKNELVFSKYSWNVIEHILLGRYAAFENIYLNKKSVTYDQIMKLTLQRFKELYKKNFQFKDDSSIQKLKPFLDDTEWTLDYIINLDDFEFHYIIEKLQNEDDEILSRLAKNFLKNKEFNTVERGDLSFYLKDLKDKQNNYYFHQFEAQNKAVYDFSMPIKLYHYNRKNEIVISKLEDKSMIFKILKKDDDETKQTKKLVFYSTQNL